MKKIKYILLALSLMSSPIFASSKVAAVTPKTYEAYKEAKTILGWTYHEIEFDNIDDYYIWEISDYKYVSQFITGKYHKTNCVPTTICNLMNILGIEHDETVQEIKSIMKDSTSENILKYGTTVDECVRFLKHKNIPFKTQYLIQNKEQMKELIEQNIIVVNVALQYVEDYYTELANKNNDMNSFNYNHCVMIVGYQETGNDLELLILDTNTNKLSVWDYEKWKLGYEKCANKPYGNKLLMFEVEKIKDEDIIKSLQKEEESKTSSFFI